MTAARILIGKAELQALQRRLGVPADGVFGDGTLAAITRLLPAAAPAPAPSPAPKAARKLTFPAEFFAAARSLTGPLDRVQVDTVNRLLAGAAHWPTSWLAYGLATAWHEARLKPIEEIGKGKGRKYGVPGKHGGQVAYGRGLAQLTWDYNYERADSELKLRGGLIRDYTVALDPDIAARILVRGMEEGWFTGRSLKTYLPDALGTASQFREARRIINGIDRAEMIAGQALKFQQALRAGGWL